MKTELERACDKVLSCASCEHYQLTEGRDLCKLEEKRDAEIEEMSKIIVSMVNNHGIGEVLKSVVNAFIDNEVLKDYVKEIAQEVVEDYHRDTSY